MGRWVTSKGRRIYIPDEGEENPYAKKDNSDSSMPVIKANDGRNYTIKKKKNGDYVVGYITPSGKFVGQDGTNSLEHAKERLQWRVDVENKFNKPGEKSKITSKTGGLMDRGRPLDTVPKTKSQIAKDQDEKEKQIARNKKEAEIRSDKYADDEHKPTGMGEMKKGEFFKLSNKPNGKVYVKGEYDKSEKAYWCYEYYDVNSGRYFKKGKTVYTGFTF